MVKRSPKSAEPQRECNSCGWFGVTDRMLGSIGPLCPECGETTELSSAMDELQLKFESLLKDNTAMPCHARQQLAVVMVTFAQVHFALTPASLPQVQNEALDEREALRAEQARIVMPLIGPLLDAYEGSDKEELEGISPDLVRYLNAINRGMEGEATDQKSIKPVGDA